MAQLTLSLKAILGALYNPLTGIAQIIGIIIVSIVVVKIGSYVIKKFFEKQKSLKYIDKKRIDTISTLLVSTFRYTIYIIAGISVLTYAFKESVLAAAGVGGIVLGLGTQSLIRDIVAGFFIVFEDQYVVGDSITIDNMSGTVEQMELRVTKLRNSNGDLHIIPNGEIKKLTNHARGNKTVLVDIPVSYGTDVAKAVEIANSVCACVTNEACTIVEQPKALGITEFGRDSMNIRITAKTLPDEQEEVERRIRMMISERFSKEGIGFFDKRR